MADQEKKIMQTCGDLMQKMTPLEKEKFLSFTEGMAFLSARLTCDSAPERTQA